MAPPAPQLVSLPNITIHALAKMIDHSLLHPTLTDTAMDAGLALSATYNVATACVKPSHVLTAAKYLSATPNHSVLVCPVVGFPHGTSLPSTKCAEAAELIALTGPGAEIDVVLNTGKVLSGDWEYITNELKSVNDLVVRKGCILKVIFENDYYMSLSEGECTSIITRLCEICCDVGVAFAKTSTGYGFVKDMETGMYGYVGARMKDLKLMVSICQPRGVQVKAAGGVRSLDDLLRVRAIGVTRVGATATKEILEEARRRGIPEGPEGPEGGVTLEVDVAKEIGAGY